RGEAEAEKALEQVAADLLAEARADQIIRPGEYTRPAWAAGDGNVLGRRRSRHQRREQPDPAECREAKHHVERPPQPGKPTYETLSRFFVQSITGWKADFSAHIAEPILSGQAHKAHWTGRNEFVDYQINRKRRSSKDLR